MNEKTGSWVARFRQRRARRRAEQVRTSWVYCPTCRRDLNGDNESFVEDTDLVHYVCATCGTLSEFLFDAPAPILIRSTPQKPSTSGVSDA